jgi:S-adenosylmethionine:tRNA ribosyltransferase-isomerase
MRDFLRGRVEALLTRQVGAWEWEALVRPGRKIGVGERLYFGGEQGGDDEVSNPHLPNSGRCGAPAEAGLVTEVVDRGEFGQRTLRFEPVEDFFGMLERLGHVPLPPYIARGDRAEDRERYQTVYARQRGSVAAPTAGLHFTPAVLGELRRRGIETAELTLHVGLGTFQPVHAERVEDHKLHREWYEISEPAAEAINRALEARRRVVAVGTTTVRTLEFAAGLAGATNSGERDTAVGGRCLVPIPAGRGEADIFIYPGFQFRVVGAMLTNFHLPKSTLLMLVSAFAGREPVLAAYEYAVRQKYRFYSYGDCMFIE